MEHLKQIGTVVYLQLSCEEINRRLGDLKQRGVALKDGQTLEELYAERVPLYEKYADVTFSAKEKESARSYPTCPLTLPCEFLLNSISEDSFVTLFYAAKESFIQLKNT